MKLLVAVLVADTASNSSALATSPRGMEDGQGGKMIRDGLPCRLIWNENGLLNPCAYLIDQIGLEYPWSRRVSSILENLLQLPHGHARNRNAAKAVSGRWRVEGGERSWGEMGHDDVWK